MSLVSVRDIKNLLKRYKVHPLKRLGQNFLIDDKVKGKVTIISPKKIPLKDAELPSLFSPPSGCVFHPRCPYSSEICSQEEPELMPLVMANEHDHLVACHHVKEIPPWGETISHVPAINSNK